jgi:hypothetical protein
VDASCPVHSLIVVDDCIRWDGQFRGIRDDTFVSHLAHLNGGASRVDKHPRQLKYVAVWHCHWENKKDHIKCPHQSERIDLLNKCLLVMPISVMVSFIASRFAGKIKACCSTRGRMEFDFDENATRSNFNTCQ